MATYKRKRAIAFACCVSILLTSCTSLNRVSIPGAETTAAVPAVQVGDAVVITTRSGEKKGFKVTAVEADALAGKGERVLYTEMASLSVKYTSAGKSALAVAAVVFGILIIVGIESMGDGIEETVETVVN